MMQPNVNEQCHRPIRQGGNRPPRSVAYLSVLEFLCLRWLPARLTAWMVAALLGFEDHHIAILVAAGLLDPLGDPPKTAPKYFGRDYILGLAADERWLARASDALVAHWAKGNAVRK